MLKQNYERLLTLNELTEELTKDKNFKDTYGFKVNTFKDYKTVYLTI